MSVTPEDLFEIPQFASMLAASFLVQEFDGDIDDDVFRENVEFGSSISLGQNFESRANSLANDWQMYENADSCRLSRDHSIYNQVRSIMHTYCGEKESDLKLGRLSFSTKVTERRKSQEAIRTKIESLFTYKNIYEKEYIEGDKNILLLRTSSSSNSTSDATQFIHYFIDDQTVNDWRELLFALGLLTDIQQNHKTRTSWIIVHAGSFGAMAWNSALRHNIALSDYFGSWSYLHKIDALNDNDKKYVVGNFHLLHSHFIPKRYPLISGIKLSQAIDEMLKKKSNDSD